MTLAMPMFYVFILDPLTHKTNPLNASIERFMLEPSRELQRIDLAIRRHLDALSRENPKSQLIRKHLNQVASLRPQTSSATWHQSLYSKVVPAWLSIYVQANFAFVFFFYSLCRIIEKPFCIINGIEDCNLRSIFTAGDSIQMAAAIMILLGLSFAYYLMVILLLSINTLSQLALIRATKADLDRCLATIRVGSALCLDKYLLGYN